MLFGLPSAKLFQNKSIGGSLHKAFFFFFFPPGPLCPGSIRNVITVGSVRCKRKKNTLMEEAKKTKRESDKNQGKTTKWMGIQN